MSSNHLNSLYVLYVYCAVVTVVTMSQHRETMVPMHTNGIGVFTVVGQDWLELTTVIGFM